MSKRIIIVARASAASAFLGISRRLHSKDNAEVVLIDKNSYDIHTIAL